MFEIFSGGFVVSMLTGTIRMSVPILLPALGDIYTQRSGILNLGIEGIMLMGALAGFIGVAFTNSLFIGIMFSIIIGMVFAGVMAFLSVTVKANQVIAGTAITILGTGLSSFLFRAIFGVQKLPPLVREFPVYKIPVLSDIPYIGTIFFEHNIFIYLTYILVPVTWLILEKTTFGLNVCAVGEHPHAADAKGINVSLTRYMCVLISGAYAGLGGAFLSIGFMNTFLAQMVGGRGFIAIAVVIFSRWEPFRALAAALLFGIANALQLRLQAMGVPFPPQALQALPYIITIIVLLCVSRRAEFPSAYTIPFRREER